MDDPYNLQRFISAQDLVYRNVCSELQAGYKSGHWMWFIFPQIQGLGKSDLSRKFAISSLNEAKAYLGNPILSSRLRECTRLVNLIQGRSVEQIFGSIDSMKFQSSMTLFASATLDNGTFKEALEKYFGGDVDRQTLARL